MIEIVTTGSIAAIGGSIAGFVTNLYSRWRNDSSRDRAAFNLASKVDDLESRINTVHLDLAKNYITRGEVKDALDDIKRTMERIETKVDEKRA